MATMYDYVNVRCPFFVASGKCKIACEGLTEGSNICLSYQTFEMRNAQRQRYCDSNYEECEIAKILNKKYED